MVSIKFEFPDTGEGVTEGKFLEWKVEEGDSIEEDEVVGEAETDKAVVEIPAPSDGSVKNLKVAPGDKVEVGEVIMELETEEVDQSTEEEEESDEKDLQDSEDSSEDVIEDIPVSGSGTSSVDENSSDETERSASESSSGDVLALPKARKLAEEKGVELASIKTGERITEEEVLEAASDGESSEASGSSSSTRSSGNNRSSQDVKATPSVRKLAREKGIDITKVEGSGRGGKITRSDVEDFEEPDTGETQETGSVSEDVENHPVHSSRDVEREKMSGIRQKIADRMEKSRFTAPHVTHVEKADVTELKELREREKDEVDPHLTYLPFIMNAAKEALEKYPDLNAELDTEKNEIVHKNYYDFNIAVDTDHGLLVPRIKDVDGKSVIELASEIGEKASKAKSGDLSSEEMKNGTFSITNLGVIGGEEFTPIINYPQVAILGIGRIGETAEVVDDEVVPRTTVKLSLSYDHRVVDGATAARFMNELVENLENPEKMLLEL
ncbi:MAG: dihydrolipoamide acetyltransferase family protein [Candidatus Nanosalina sp.]